MQLYGRKVIFYNLLSKLLWFIGALTILLMIKRVRTGEKFYHWEFSYDRCNLGEILHDVERNGKAAIPPINKLTEQFKTLKDPARVLCRNSKCDQIDMLFIVKSFVANIGQRAAIRKTWGKTQNTRIKTIFILGYLEDFRDIIDVESNTHNDILQFDIIDVYDNLVFKTMFTFMWYLRQRINATYVHFLDDDRFVNTNNLYQFAMKNLKETDLKMFGHKLTLATPYRGSTSKWSISLKDYPYDFWPPYLIGGTILTNSLVARKLAKVAPYVKLIKIEDSLTGIMAKLLKIKLIHNSGFLPEYEEGSKLKDKFSSPNYKSYSSHIEGWNALHS